MPRRSATFERHFPFRHHLAPMMAACGAALLLGLIACGDRDRGGDAAPPPRPSARTANPTDKLEDVVSWRGGLTLEENREVINVFPQVSLAPDGDYLVADGREAQVRVYGADGHLLRWFGRRGKGPEEFTRPVAALPHDGGSVLTLDMTGSYAVFAAGGTRARETGTVTVPVIYGAKPMRNGRVLLVGRSFEGRSPYLHVWDPSQKKVVRSFFVPPVRRGWEDEAIMAGVMAAAVRNDSVAAVFALTDSVFLFTPEGERIGAFRIPARRFRPMNEEFRAKGREAFMEWNATHSMLSAIHWLPDGSFLLQYYDMVDNDQRFSTLRLARNGDLLFEIPGTPRLLAVSPDGKTLVFAKPDAEAPNQWQLATLR